MLTGVKYLLFVGIGKKIDALAKQKDCEDAGLWRKSIVNHLYWVAATAPEGNQDMIEAMWKSVCNHIQDIHEDHSDLYRHVHMALWTKKRGTKSGCNLVGNFGFIVLQTNPCY